MTITAKSFIRLVCAASITSMAVFGQGSQALSQTEVPASLRDSTIAATQAPTTQRYLLLATFGYLGGQAGFLLNKGNGAAAELITIVYNSASQCTFAENQLKEKWRNDVLNTLCMPFPEGAVVAR
jgi:hypothetical protein